jgi:hypothetical protein
LGARILVTATVLANGCLPFDGRWMAQTAALLADEVIPRRRGPCVLSLPFALR